MSLFRFLWSYVHLLVVMVTAFAGPDRHFQETIGRGQKGIFKESFQNEDEHKVGISVVDAKKLNEVVTVADLASLMVSRDRRFCTDVTLKNIETMHNITGRRKSKKYNNQMQESMKVLKETCAQIKRGRSKLEVVPDIPLKEIKNVTSAVMEINKVSCNPKMVQVELPSAPPGYYYYPKCVMLKQCTGCCPSDVLECKPVKRKTVKKWVFKMSIQSGLKYEKSVPIPLEQHEKCKCDCKILRSHCNEVQVYDENNCQCDCPNKPNKNFECGEQRKWDPTLCACTCKLSPTCSTGQYVDPASCKCVTNKNLQKSSGRRGKRRRKE